MFRSCDTGPTCEQPARLIQIFRRFLLWWGLHAAPVPYPHFPLELSGPDKLKQVVLSSHNPKEDPGSRHHARRASPPSVTWGGALGKLCPSTHAQQGRHPPTDVALARLIIDRVLLLAFKHCISLRMPAPAS